MARISITDIGPIRDITLSLNRFNIFIGPQGSGKSTVAKIVSFCQWLEKDCVRRQLTSHVDSRMVTDQLIGYHNMDGYFSDASRFEYAGDFLDISFDGNGLHVHPKENFCTAPVAKIAYIPAERNVISIPGIFSTKMPYNYILDFIEDWLRIRSKYVSGQSARLLDPQLSYSYDSETRSDLVTDHKSGRSYLLSQVSSGMQSLTPLCVCIDYLTSWIFSHTEERSAEEKQMLRKAAASRWIAKTRGIKDTLEFAKADDRLKEQLNIMTENIEFLVDRDPQPDEAEIISELREIVKTAESPSFSNIVVEEPELNLFPSSQLRLVYFMLSRINKSSHRLTLTTHSPYILYAVNNCMLAWKAARHDSRMLEGLTDIPADSIIDPSEVSVWQLAEGSVDGGEAIQDETGMIRDNYFDNIMQDIISV